MPLKLVADSLDHSQCSHTREEDEETAEGPLEVTLVYIRHSCVHLIKDAKWKDHKDELQAFLLECKMKGSVADMRRLEILQLLPAPKRDPKQVDELIMKGIHTAFGDPYQGEGDEVLLAIMDYYYDAENTGITAGTATKPYNYSLAMVQSSGMGKSRTVDMAAQKRFAFLLNLRDDGSVDHFSYPPPDIAVREYFTELQIASYSNEMVQSRLGAFFTALFREAASAVAKFPNTGDLTLAKWWHSQMQEGNTEHQVGTGREAFYGAVVKQARLIAASKDFSESSARRSVKSTCRTLMNALAIEHSEKSPAPTVKFFIAIDEAHIITSQADKSHAKRSVYHNLGTVLSWLNTDPIFTIFLSTNSRLQELAAPADLQPSLRASKGAKLFPPVTELPFDTFATGIYSKLKENSPNGPVSLNSVCDIGVIVKFGRPLWYSLYKTAYGTRDAIIALAKDKLSGPSVKSYLSLNAKLACLSIRIMLEFDSAREIGRAAVSELVEAHMRVVFAVPKHRGFMRTGTPSEPILAETAARILNTDSNGDRQLVIDTLAPQTLAQSLQRGLLARGERGEMVTRLLWIIAHDKAIESMYGMDLSEGYLRFHRPISVIEFLKALFHKDHHEVILSAKPVGDPEGPPLREAFKDAYLNFTHFALAADSQVIQVSQIFRTLLRGTAIQCRNNQESIDHVTAVLFGDPAVTEIRQEAASTMQGQTKNRIDPQDDLQISPTITHPNDDLPVLSLQHELGASYSGVRYVERNACNLRKGSKGMNAHKRHYHIAAYGASSATYAAIPPSADGIYAALLASTHVIDDFPRASLPGSLRMMNQMIPAMQYAENGFTWF